MPCVQSRTNVSLPLLKVGAAGGTTSSGPARLARTDDDGEKKGDAPFEKGDSLVRNTISSLRTAWTYVLGSSARRMALNVVPGLRRLRPAWTAPTRLSSSRSATEWIWYDRMPDGCEGGADGLPASCSSARVSAGDEEGGGETWAIAQGP